MLINSRTHTPNERKHKQWLDAGAHVSNDNFGGRVATLHRHAGLKVAVQDAHQ